MLDTITTLIFTAFVLATTYVSLLLQGRVKHLEGKLHALTRYNGLKGSYMKAGKNVSITCLATYRLKDATYCVVENASSADTTVYSIPLSRVVWDGDNNDV